MSDESLYRGSHPDRRQDVEREWWSFNRCETSSSSSNVAEGENVMEYVAGAAVMFVVGIITAGVVFDMQADEIRELKAYCFALVEQVTDQQARKHPLDYVMRADGVDVVVERGRPDLPPPRQSVEPTGKVLVMPEIDDLPTPEEDKR